MALANPLYGLRATFTDKCGKPLIGGKVFSYEGNSLTPKTTYTDAFMSTPNTNPVVLDETGKADIFLDGTYRFQVFSRDGVLIEDKNNVSNILDLGPIIEKLDQFNTDFQKNISDFQNEKAAALEDFENTGGEKLAEFQQEINIAAAAGAGANGWTDLLVQLQDGSSLRQFIDIQKNKNSERVSIADFGAKGNDDQTIYDIPAYMTGRDKAFSISQQTADGIAINRALDWLKARGGGSLYVPPCEKGKSYRIWGYLKQIDFPCVIYGAGAASLFKNCDNSPTNTNGYGMFVVQPKNSEEVSFLNLKLDGNAEVRAKPTSEFQLYPLIVYGMPRFRMYGVTSENSPIDCFTTTFDTGFDAEGLSCFATIVNCLFNNSYRNTVTVSKGHNIKFVNSFFQRGGFIHGGTNPRYCVDIEPNMASTVVNSKFVNCTFSHGRNVLVGGVWSDSMFSNCTFDASYVHPDNAVVGRQHFPWVFQFTAGQWDIDNCKFVGRKDYMRNQCHHYNAYGSSYNFTDDVYLRIKNSTFVYCGLISAGRSISIENCTAQLSMCPFLFQGGTASPTHDVFIKNLRLTNVFDGSNVGTGAASSLTVANSIKGVVDIDGVICEVDERSIGKIPVSLFEDINYFGVWLPSQLGSYGRRARIRNVYCEGYYNRIHAYTGFTKSTTKRRDWGAPNAAPADTDPVTSSVSATLTNGTVTNNVVANLAVTGTATQNNAVASRTLGGRTTITWKDCTMWGDYN
ncbi:hypothetical protein NVV24_13445 [Acinetobacter radioresistens]|uniref:hypothetical protein n=1 Tax=Acinetobacter radioresistens TaxID=40216 RepID=UPI00224516B8|nr:hypothetical protein [Acinetobacter radioresistens]MCX0343643.1 hypothetical protein [Acinetobacter radioresistens]